MPPPLKPPYLAQLETRGKYQVWSVDGAWIRTNEDEEFTNFGQHYRFKFIPDHELWIDREATPDEQHFYVEHLLIEHRLMARGASYERAIDAADKAERRERRRSGDLGKLAPKARALPDPRKAHKRLWKRLESGVSVWIVDGRAVRSVFDIDFTEGGHDKVYEFVPDDEVWIDDDVSVEERPYVLLHELHERNLMCKGWPYSRAHADSSRLEYHCRHHADELHDALCKEGWA